MKGSMRPGTGLIVMISCLMLLAGCQPQARPAAPAAPPASTVSSPRPTNAPIKATAQLPAATDIVPTATSSPAPSPSPEPAPAETTPPEAAAAEACSNAAQFVADVTIPDNAILPPEQTFVKTWRLRNTGTCTWDTSYRLVRDSGAELGGPAGIGLSPAVAHNETVDISAQLVAPSAPGVYTGDWQLADAGSSRFGPKIRVVIVVPDPSQGEELPDTLVVLMATSSSSTTTQPCAFDSPAGGEQPVTVTPTKTGEQGTRLCIYGLPPDSKVTVTLVSPTGTSYSAQFDVGEPMKPALSFSGTPVPLTTVVGIPLMWPATAPEGVWRLSVQGDGFQHETSISVSPTGRGGLELRMSPLDSFNPFDTLEDGSSGYTLSYPIGERVQFIGSGYQPNARIPLGIYRRNDRGDYSLVHGQMAMTDRAGRFEIIFRIPDTFAPGEYRATGVLSESEKANGIQVSSHFRDFFIRGGIEDPLPSLHVSTSQPAGEPLKIVVAGTNFGRPAARGASLTVSSPDAERLVIEDADVPVIEPAPSNCNTTAPHAWVLGPQSPCNRALQYGTNCKGTVQLSALMAEGWYKPWATGATQVLSVRLWPRTGVREVRVYARMAMLAGPSGCRIVTAPEAGKADGTDQQGFPVQVVTVVTQSSNAPSAGCDGTTEDLTEPSLWWREDDKMNGEPVERLQRRLLELGYQLPLYGADGWFGAETDAAVREFQRRNGLVVDGNAGPITWACLKNSNAARGD